MKQGAENTQFVKDKDEPTKQFIFQKNKKTIIGTIFIVIVLVLIIAVIVYSGVEIKD